MPDAKKISFSYPVVTFCISPEEIYRNNPDQLAHKTSLLYLNIDKWCNINRLHSVIYVMTFLSHEPDIEFTKPMMGVVIASTMLSTVPGVSAAGPSPEATTLTPNLDAELIVNGAITSMPIIPVSPSGCATPATLTRAMMELTGVEPIIVNAGLKHTPPIPCVDVYGEYGNDPRKGDAVL